MAEDKDRGPHGPRTGTRPQNVRNGGAQQQESHRQASEGLSVFTATRHHSYPHQMVFSPPLPLGPLSCLGGSGRRCHRVRPGAEGAGCLSFRAVVV